MHRRSFSFFFYMNRALHCTQNCLVQYSYFQATKLSVFSIQLVCSHPKDILYIVVVGHFGGVLLSIRRIQCPYIAGLSC